MILFSHRDRATHTSKGSSAKLEFCLRECETGNLQPARLERFHNCAQAFWGEFACDNNAIGFGFFNYPLCIHVRAIHLHATNILSAEKYVIIDKPHYDALLRQNLAHKLTPERPVAESHPKHESTRE